MCVRTRRCRVISLAQYAQSKMASLTVPAKRASSHFSHCTPITEAVEVILSNYPLIHTYSVFISLVRSNGICFINFLLNSTMARQRLESPSDAFFLKKKKKTV